MLTKIAVIATLAYAGVCFGLYLMQDRMVFFPSAGLFGTPDRVRLAYQDAWMTAADGRRIHGWFVPSGPPAPPGGGSPPRGTVLFLHGNAGNISDRLDTLRILHDSGFATLMVDYAGYGQSEGSPSEAATYADASAAWQYLLDERGVSAGEIVVFGRSLGGAVAVWLAATRSAEGTPPRALIVESSFTSLPDVAAAIYPYFPVRWLSRNRYQSAERIGSVRCPILIAHSPGDETIPFAHGVELFRRSPEPRYFLRLRGGHNGGHTALGPDYGRALAAFADLARAPHGSAVGPLVAPLTKAPEIGAGPGPAM